MKVARACKQCRSVKRRCVKSEAHKSCAQCLRRALDCSFSYQHSALQHQSILPNPAPACQVPSTTTSTWVGGLDSDLRDELVELYFRLIHDKPHTLFYQPTLKRQIQNGSVHLAVLYGVLGIAARFSSDDTRLRTSEFGACAKAFLKKDIDRICLENVQASVLIGNICGAESDSDAESLFFGIAIRMAQILHLPKPHPSDDAIAAETKCRVWWSLYMIDQWASAGVDLPRQIRNDNDNILPMHELDFRCLQSREALSTTRTLRPSLWAHMISLAQIFGRIQDLHWNHTSGNLSDAQVEAIAQKLAMDLERFVEDLPLSDRLTMENLKQHADQGLGQAFVALHLGYHHYATLLYFQYLDMQLDPTPITMLFASRCKKHAAAFSDLLRTARERAGCEAVYVIVAHMTVVSSSALLYTLLFGEDYELPSTRERLRVNFETLIQLRNYWPAVSMMMDRLFAFQDICMWSADPNTHKVDKWMVKFLLQHNLPVDKNKVEAVEGSSADYHRAAERGKVARDALSIHLPQS
ncbi:hypothetical protein K469DRAFT_626977 [Zopfia rhizophila CBS 207.26]|uniref:Zn(2)-C6 fungal-type domain-containing protein n=1 Tax=Zopfia rhizophila CBS 207.26 TaxID=1314779 RepID=A0A6A6ED16_9PEZI|nr:hypothetical protein K469DRAFT_626977 [Zopfia rhizophila CBS 207.26]